MVIDSGRTIAEVATELGLGAQLLGKWVKTEKETMTPTPLGANEREELIRLRKKSVELRTQKSGSGALRHSAWFGEAGLWGLER